MKSKAIIWKELLDLSRDKRTLAAMILIPFIGLPAIALLASGLTYAQTTTVYIEVLDKNSTDIARFISSQLISYADSNGLKVNVTISDSSPTNVYNILLIIPKGFYNNISSINGVGVVYLKSLVGSVQSNEIESLIESILGQIEGNIVIGRVQKLSNISGIKLNATNFLNPINIFTGYYLPSGKPATTSQVELSFSARLLEFSLFFVANPAIVFMGDSILGEKERKTLETLISTPAPKTAIIVGKMFASIVIGLITAIADSLGVIIYLSMIAQGGLRLTAGLVLVTFSVSAMLVIMTAAIITPIVLRSSSVRSAQAMSYLIMMVALAIYFSTLFVDIQRLPSFIEAILLIIPFTHAALAISNYVLGQYLDMVLNFLVMIAFTLLGVYISIKAFDSERLIIAK
ncbi:MAG: ABC transporter permease subunit [Caldisphaera sp.]|jgi:ABC-2 type transport system permease protein|uniref:ABC transporter permease n=1 Tax=Caldisphaera sp. TaxID=2060322 RepID=UPI00397E0386